MYRSQRNYENLEKRLFNVPGKYGIPVIEPTHLKRKIDRKSTRLNSSHLKLSRMPSSA